MNNIASFQARARTIDHLGRGQIADAPTAVSELWKNAFDAYASRVSLHVYGGIKNEDGGLIRHPMGAVFDDGFGMNLEDFQTRWLVIGTDSKVDNVELPQLPPGRRHRIKQGEKGIGRLSAAYLAPVSLLVSKKKDHPFVAVLVDWRLFENPFLALSDIIVAIETLDRPHELPQKLPSMFERLRLNLGDPTGTANERHLAFAWERFDEVETSRGLIKTTSERIRYTSNTSWIDDTNLIDWLPFNDPSKTGTALLLLEANPELANMAEGQVLSDDPEYKDIYQRMFFTLVGFTDPFSVEPLDISYEIVVHGANSARMVLDSNMVFSYKDFCTLEHFVIGKFDETGRFHGRIRSFGIDRGEFDLLPARMLSQRDREKLGPFEFCIGTFEQDDKNTTHDLATFYKLKDDGEKYSGISVFRDGLRVMPYGRPDSDPFEIDARRGSHQGREFWAHRRSFGRLAFSGSDNPNLKDKAGREGLVDNRAFREMKRLVVDLLMQTARKFFGYGSDIREQELPGIQERNRKAKEAAERAKKARVGDFRAFIRSKSNELSKEINALEDLAQKIQTAESLNDKSVLSAAIASFECFKDSAKDFNPPLKPQKLNDRDERDQRSYREILKRYSQLLQELGGNLNRLAEAWASDPPASILKTKYYSLQSQISSRLERYRKDLTLLIRELSIEWGKSIDDDQKEFHRLASPLIENEADKLGLRIRLEELDSIREQLLENYSAKYSHIIKAISRLKEGIDLEGALSTVEDERSVLEEEVSKFVGLAQLGIAVEIVGHELENMDSQVRENLLALPSNIRQLPSYQNAMTAHKALSDRLRFLAPMSLASYAGREPISGNSIAQFVMEFFGSKFESQQINFEASKAFRSISLTERRSRIYPVFLNLVNNAMYWVQQSKTSNRRIRFDFLEGKVIVSDDGPGVDPDDVPHLFEIFFSRRSGGRGIGLHLARLNLVAGRHKIRYVQAGDPRPLEGANFILELQGLVLPTT